MHACTGCILSKHHWEHAIRITVHLTLFMDMCWWSYYFRVWSFLLGWTGSITRLIFLILYLINHSSMDWYLACFKFCKHCSVNIPAHRPKWTYVSTPVRRVSGGEIAESEFACCYFIKNILIMLKPPSKCCWFTLPQPEDTIYYYKLFQFAFALVLMRTSIFSQVKWLNFSFWPTFLLDCFFLLIYKRSP